MTKLFTSCKNIFCLITLTVLVQDTMVAEKQEKAATSPV